MRDSDGEIVADIIVNPSGIQGIELGRDAVRISYEDLGCLITLACLSPGLSEFDLDSLTGLESKGVTELASSIAGVAGASLDTGGNRVTIEGNTSGDRGDAPFDGIRDYAARTLLAIYFHDASALSKERCILELGKSLTQVILGDLLF